MPVKKLGTIYTATATIFNSAGKPIAECMDTPHYLQYTFIILGITEKFVMVKSSFGSTRVVENQTVREIPAKYKFKKTLNGNYEYFGDIIYKDSESKKWVLRLKGLPETYSFRTKKQAVQFYFSRYDF